MEERRQIRARLTTEARAAWERVLVEHGVTWTSIFEALGQDIAAGRWTPSQRTIQAARRIDRDRYSR